MTGCCCPVLALATKGTGGSTERITLNVGGCRFVTSKSTLKKFPGSALASLVDQPPDEDGVYFLDRDGQHFRHVLNFLRHGHELFIPPSTEEARIELLHEAKQLQLPLLVQALTVGVEHLEEKAEDTTQSPQETLEVPACQGAPLPRNEEERLERLDGLNVLHTATDEQEYDDITRVVAAILDVPICLVSLVAREFQWFKSKVGLGADSTSRDTSFCAFTLKPEDPKAASMLVVEDALCDPRVASNPLVLGEPRIRFYAGAPLVVSDGLRMGALCAISPVPRTVSREEAQLLVNFGHLTAQQLEKSQLSSLQRLEELSDGELDTTFAAGELRRDRMREALEEALVLVLARSHSLEWPMLYGNPTWTRLSGMHITPPVRLPGLSQVQHTATGLAASTSLWDHLFLSNSSSEQVVQMWQDIGTPESQPRTFAVTAQLSAQEPGGLPIRVSCRFTPAGQPLDAAASAVRPAAQRGPQDVRSGFRLTGLPPGELYFATLVPLSSTSSQRVEEASPARLPSSQPSMQSRSVDCEVQSSREKCPSDPGTDRLNARALADNKGTSPLNFIRPPRPPFEDVHLLRVVGEGSFGQVYFSLWSGAPVAVKIIRSQRSESEGGQIQATFEAALSAGLSHPNLVQTYKFSTREFRAEGDGEAKQEARVSDMRMMETWIVQEWCDGGTLGKYCQEPRLTSSGLLEAVEIGIEISRAGAYLHDRGIIHGDLTPNNVLIKTLSVRKGYVCKVCDFGLARVLEGETQEVLTKTIGTVTHMPPELFQINRDTCRLTVKADIYAFAMILYQVISGSRPFEGLSAAQVVVQVARGKTLPLPVEVPGALSALYTCCIAQEPEDRPGFDEITSDLFEMFRVYDAECGMPSLAELDTYRRSYSAPPSVSGSLCHPRWMSQQK